MSEISERADVLITEYGGSCTGEWKSPFSQPFLYQKSCRQALSNYISTLEAEVAELRAYRDGYDPKVRMPDNRATMWVAMPFIDNYMYTKAFWDDDMWCEVEGAYDSWLREEVTRWWPLPEVQK